MRQDEQAASDAKFIKGQCGLRKTVYRGSKQNLNPAPVLFASSLYALGNAACRLAADWA